MKKTNKTYNAPTLFDIESKKVTNAVSSKERAVHNYMDITGLGIGDASDFGEYIANGRKNSLIWHLRKKKD